MFKLVVLSALVAVALAAPAPGFLHGAPLAYSAHVGPAVAIPTAVSHQSRIDVHSSPLIATTYTAPAVHIAAPAVHAVAAPAIHAVAPAIHAPLLSAAVSHQARYDIHRNGAILAAPLAYPLAHGYAAAAPALHAW